MKYQFTQTDSLINYPVLLKNLKVDACVFLDYFQLNDHLTKANQYYLGYNDFPEFHSSTQMESIKASLYWTVAIKGDTAHYGCKHPDDLYYGNSVNPEFFGNQVNHNRLLENTSTFLGNAFGAKLLPSMIKVFRSYYRSNNTKMQLAEKYLLDGNWLNAAEIYNQLTTSKNRNISAKATFNMALVCEMEGNVNAAIDWTVGSFEAYNQKNPVHQANCMEYVNLLSKRRKELEKLEKQVR